VGSGGFLSYACYCLSLLRGWCVVYVGDASIYIALKFSDFLLMQKVCSKVQLRSGCGSALVEGKSAELILDCGLEEKNTPMYNNHTSALGNQQ
jgi:hypothetical protein